MIPKEVSVSVKWPFKVADFQFGHAEMSELVVLAEGEDPEIVRDILFDKLKNQAQEKIGQALEEIRNPQKSNDVQYAPDDTNRQSRNGARRSRRGRHGS